MDGNAAITSVVARYLSSADFRNDIGADRQKALGPCRLDGQARREFSEFDFATLENFGGLITKTQHNYLYEYLPYTRQLLQLYKLDLTVFATYRTEAQSKPAGMMSRTEKCARFIGYLHSWLQGKDDGYPALAALLEHESILWTLKNEGMAGTSDLTKTQSRTRRNARPTIHPGVRMAEFRYDPFRTIDLLNRGDRPERKHRRRYRLVYWIDSRNAQIRMAKPGRTVWDLMSLCDGKHSQRSLYSKLAPLSPASVRNALAFAEASGFILAGEAG